MSSFVGGTILTASALNSAINSLVGQTVALTSPTSATVPLTVTGAASQSANLVELKNSAAALLVSISASGVITANGQGLTSLNASSLSSGTVGSARLPSVNIGTTSVDLTRASGALTLAGITLTSPTLTSPALGTPVSGTLTNCSFPTLNQNTTGSAASLTTSRTIFGQSFNGTANVSGAMSGVTTFNGSGQMEVSSNIFITSSGSFVQHGSNTGSGQTCQWADFLGLKILVRNTSTRADKENIQSLGGVLTPTMIDAIDVTLWNRKSAPGIPEVGPMAEDMDAISPFLATHGSAIGDAGEIVRTPPEGISQNGWLSLITIALQDCRRRITELEEGSQ